MDWPDLPSPVETCCRTLRLAGHQAHPVGGCVRDLLLGRVPGDWDITTSAPPEDTMALFRRTVPTGLAHGTVTVLLGGMALEVTTFRREEGYADGRHPDAVTFDATLLQDLSRRDFTINAMALAPDGGLLDPFGGQADLKQRLVRCVGEPARRFSEDALRMLRAVRFAAQLGFSIEAETAAALRSHAPLLRRVSAERIRAEMEKILLSPAPQMAALPVELGMLERFSAPAQSVDPSSLSGSPATAADRWRALCTATGLDITALPVERALRRAVLHPEYRELAQLAVTGGELYALGLRGREISDARRAMLEHVRAHPHDNRRDALLALIPKNRT